jgi:hypothetical protein
MDVLVCFSGLSELRSGWLLLRTPMLFANYSFQSVCGLIGSFLKSKNLEFYYIIILNTCINTLSHNILTMTGIAGKIKEKVKGAKIKLLVLQKRQLTPLKKAFLPPKLLLRAKQENMSKMLKAKELTEQRILLKNMTKKNQCLQLK